MGRRAARTSFNHAQDNFVCIQLYSTLGGEVSLRKTSYWLTPVPGPRNSVD